MKTKSYRIVLAIGLLSLGSAFAQAPAAAPAGSTGLCKDGSYTTHATKAGACSGHQGVKDWFVAAAAGAAATTAAPAVPAAAAAPKAMPMSPAPKVTKMASPAAAPVAQAPGGGAGQVWVNGASKVYHCAGTKYYGKTKQGEYMTEAAAKAAGNHADHGKACTG